MGSTPLTGRAFQLCMQRRATGPGAEPRLWLYHCGGCSPLPGPQFPHLAGEACPGTQTGHFSPVASLRSRSRGCQLAFPNKMDLLSPPLPPSGPIYSTATTPWPPRHGYPGLPVSVSPLPSQPGTLPQCYSLFALCRPNFGMPQSMAAPFRLNCHLHPDPELPSVCVVLTLNGLHLLLWGLSFNFRTELGVPWGPSSS